MGRLKSVMSGGARSCGPSDKEVSLASASDIAWAQTSHYPLSTPLCPSTFTKNARQPVKNALSPSQRKAVQFSSVAQSCPTLCNPMGCRTPGLPVYHQLPEFAQTHAHQVDDAIQPSHPLSSPSPPAFNLSQHQGVFQ